MPAGILVDLAGPKIRLGQLTQNPLVLHNGAQVRFVRGTEFKADDELTCIYEPLIDEVSLGDAIVLADGLARLKVVSKKPAELVCDIVDGGAIRSRQGVNLPGTSWFGYGHCRNSIYFECGKAWTPSARSLSVEQNAMSHFDATT